MRHLSDIDGLRATAGPSRSEPRALIAAPGESAAEAAPVAGNYLLIDRSGRLKELDSLRGIAAASVVLFHLTYWYDNFHAAPIRVWWGHFGVELFFIISGFVIFMTIERSRNLADFAVSRLARLMPAYWAGVILTSAVAWLVPIAWDNSPPSFTLVAINMTMLQRFLMFPEIDNSYWTLAIELSFYVFMGLALRTGSLRQIELLCLAWLVLAAVARTTLAVLDEHRNLGPISSITGLFYGQFFILGIALYRMHAAQWSQLTVVVASCACLMSLFGGGPYSLHAPPLVYFSVTLFLAALVGAAVFGWTKILRWAPLVLLGEMSYPLYLVHQRIGTTALRAAHSAELPPWAQTVCALIVVLILAWVVHRWVEVPGRAFIKTMYSTRKQ